MFGLNVADVVQVLECDSQAFPAAQDRLTGNEPCQFSVQAQGSRGAHAITRSERARAIPCSRVATSARTNQETRTEGCFDPEIQFAGASRNTQPTPNMQVIRSSASVPMCCGLRRPSVSLATTRGATTTRLPANHAVLPFPAVRAEQRY